MTLPASLAQVLNDFQLASYPSVTGSPTPITARSIAYFLGALGWAWLLLVSFAGWGRAAGKLLRTRLPASVACAVGIAFIVFLGGWLNLVHAIYPSVLFALTGIGFILYFLLRKERPDDNRWKTFWNRASGWSRLLITITLLILVFRVAATVRLGQFNSNDDGPAYLVFPQKMLATHHFAPDPFSDRRVISSLGGAYLLQSFVISPMSLSHVAMADRTLGFLLLAAAIFDLGIMAGLSAFQIALMEFLAFLVPQETINLTFVILPVSLLLGIVWLIWRAIVQKEDRTLTDAFLVGAIGGLIVSLKSTYLPIVVAFALIPYPFVSWRSEKIKAFRFSIIAGMAALLFAIAWMIAMKATSGTYLFPILGAGVDYSSSNLFRSAPRFTTHRALIKIVLQAFVLLVLICIQYISRMRKDTSRLGVGILAASALAITAFNYKSGADFIWRYNFPQFFVAILTFYVVTQIEFREYPTSTALRRTSYAGIAALAAMIFYYDAAGQRPMPFRQVFAEKQDFLTAIRASLGASILADPNIEAKYRAAAAAIPANSMALENVGYPFLFGDGVRKIYVMDWPGAAGPKPGWPIGKGSSKLAEYLRMNSVRYLIYDSDYISWDNMADCMTLENPQRYSTELYVLFHIALLANHQFQQLHGGYKSIYDDGKLSIIDLQRPLPNAASDGPIWTLNTDKNRMCSEIAAHYLSRRPHS